MTTTVTPSVGYDVWLTVSGALAGIVGVIVTIALVLAFCTWCKCCPWYACLRQACAWMVIDASEQKAEDAMEEVLVISDDESEDETDGKDTTTLRF